MNLVVNFLSLLCAEPQTNGSVRRMLAVCAEFERIAKVVLERIDKETHNRRKRKTAEERAAENGTGPNGEDLDTPLVQQQQRQQEKLNQRRLSSVQPGTPMLNANGGTPAPPGSTGFSTPDFGQSPAPQSTGNPPSLAPLGPELNSFSSPRMPGATPQPQQQQGGVGNSGVGNGGVELGNSFEQPFVPQDLWQMPMTLEWDWADMSGLGGWEDGISMNGVLTEGTQGQNGQR
ncbi:hypothetical protein M501DRAFT_589744 [Patellaria atrata CBS 101060]|uniref:Uncharacterized protein n=1 Tax=Patellaria atrata CBS 101060 TaxID=1346257 RepID=A0A9P4S1F7_9PEZI|nr:hypothetical protein M501DRAFT_589744 [Patellaria atrata CBS 101060]